MPLKHRAKPRSAANWRQMAGWTSGGSWLLERIEILDLLATMKKEAQRWCRVVHPFTSGDGRGHVVLLLCLVFLAILLRTAWLSDDALITLRTVLNFTHGYGLTFNVAERVQTYTHPLWMLMLTGTYLVAGNVYYAAIGLSVGISLVVFWSTLRLAATSAQVWIVAAVLLFSRAFVDYSTSGLENPLSNLLFVAFVALLFRSSEARVTSPPRLTGLWMVASLLYLTRPDNVLLVAPALVWLTARAGSWKLAARQTFTGLLPAAVWTAFSVIYYGFPFPNTAYAKLGHGIDRGELVQQGSLYLLDSIDRDPVTLVAILFAVTMGLACRGPARWIAAGVLIDLAYVVSVGGDFMSGRFLTLPLFAAVLILGRAVPFERARALTAASLLAVVGLTSAQIPLLSDSRVERTDASMGPRSIADERAFYFQEQSLLLANRQSFPPPEWPTGATQPVPTSVDILCGGLGKRGLQGPLTHLLDECALADPLLARLPAVYSPEWRIGHFRRMIPNGYRESLELGTDLLTDNGLRPLYDDIRLITRAPKLLSRARLAAIWRVSTGADQRQIDRQFYRLGRSAVLHVRWVQSLGNAQRAALERSLGLSQPEHRDGSTWRYQVSDVSPERFFETIVAHDMVDDIYGFDRAADARFGPVVHVRWVETLEDVQRTALERALGLYRAEHRGGTTWSYRVPVSDVSPERFETIVAHDMVDDIYGFDRAADARFGPVVHVRWVETLEDVQRTALERALGLYRAEHHGGTTWSYQVPDASPQRLLAIVAHDMVADTNGFDRGSLELDAPVGDVARLVAQPLVYTSGWHPVESDATLPESTWQWTQQTATLSFANPNADAEFYLDYTARPDLVTGAPQTVTVRAGDQELQSFVAHTAGRRLRRIPLSTAVQGTSEQVEIQIDVDHTFVSATLPAGERHLGIQVHHAFVVLR